ncbi:helix-turn-helix domain-containing protein [Pectinatus frisingensis]|uniref:helix-turn-helix domain-containing protein n=1 Tax=Pectinatus frisingensis TaxID=865 RepID=UPI0018C6D75F|nr:helix-turn-helix domain-containing protein [Pectinatus frisingensis]
MAIESLLQQIQPAVQKTAQAIAEVIGLEVEVADSNFIRIAGTGKYSENCGEIMNAGFIYNHVLKTGKMIMIEHPGFHILCQPCPNYKNCPEHTELAAPIIFNNTPVGVIGLVSFDEEQTRHFMENKEWMVQFIRKMAELIESNIAEAAVEKSGGNDKYDELNLADLERRTIKKALEEVEGEVRKAEKAAKMLGISRATLYRKIQEYSLIDKY